MNNKSEECVCLISLGCAKNQVDSEIISTGLLEAGFCFVGDPSEADIILVNSCSFIEAAARESLEVLTDIAQYRQKGPCRCLVLAGCLIQRYGRKLAVELPEIDLFIGMHAIENTGIIISNYLNKKTKDTFFTRPLPVHQTNPGRLHERRAALGSWAYIKIAEGCSNACTYCTLPFIRGPLKSRIPEQIIAEAENLADQGVVEINLVAQDVTAYGKDWGKPRIHPLIPLLEDLHRINGIHWIRLLYCHPAHLDDDLIAFTTGSGKICPYFDIPIQHVSTPVLKAMNRPYNEQKLRRLIEKLRSACPDIALRTTIMVGFPGETEQDMAQLLYFLKDVRFHHLGAFCYSPEKGTAIYSQSDTVDQEEKHRRHHEIMSQQAAISLEIQKGFIGSRQEVLIEGPDLDDSGNLRARTRYQAPEVDGIVRIKNDLIPPQAMAMVRITHAETYDLKGELFCKESKNK